MIVGAFGTGDRVAASVVRATPLLLVGAGITIAFRASVINIGGEGQIIAGALLSTAAPIELPSCSTDESSPWSTARTQPGKHLVSRWPVADTDVGSARMQFLR